MPNMSASPDDSTAILADLKTGLARIEGMRDEYERRKAFLEGDVAEVFVHRRLKRLLGAYSDAFKLNYAAVPVDALDDRIDLSSLTVAEDEALTARLKSDLWEFNDLDDDADAWHRNALGLGDFYAVGWPADDEDDEDAPATVGQGIELFGKSPFNCIIIYDSKNRRRPAFGVFYWIAGKDLRATVYYDDGYAEFIAPDGARAGTSPSKMSRWKPFVDVNDDGILEEGDGFHAHEYGFNVFHFRPDGKPYGKPVNAGAYGPQNAITKINVSHMSAIDSIGTPQRYGLLDPAAEEGDDIDDDFDNNLDGDTVVDPARDASKAVKTQGTLDGGPGTMQLFAGLKEVGQFDPAASTPYLEAEEFQIRAAATLTRTPLYEFDTSGEVPSGESRRRADGPITKHANKIKGTFGQTWGAIGAFALKVWNVGDGKVVEPVWLPSELATDKEGLELVGMKIENGIPPRQALLEAGYTNEQVNDWMPEGSTPTTPKMVALIAPALQALGAAVTLGVISSEQARDLLPMILTSTAPEAVVAQAVATPAIAAPVPPGDVVEP